MTRVLLIRIRIEMNNNSSSNNNNPYMPLQKNHWRALEGIKLDQSFGKRGTGTLPPCVQDLMCWGYHVVPTVEQALFGVHTCSDGDTSSQSSSHRRRSSRDSKVRAKVPPTTSGSEGAIAAADVATIELPY